MPYSIIAHQLLIDWMASKCGTLAHSQELEKDGESAAETPLIKMSKVAWPCADTSNESNDLETILGPIFTLLRCFGINFHEPSTKCRFLYETAKIGWAMLTLGTCGFRLMIYFPYIFTSSFVDVGSGKTVTHHWIEFLNYWIYVLAVYIGTVCMARWPAAKLWATMEQVLLQIPFAREDVARCRTTSILCICGCLVALLLNLIFLLTVEMSLEFSWKRIAMTFLSVVYFYSFGSSVLFICSGRIIWTAFETVARQLELNCCPPSTHADVVWTYQRQFGVACRAAEKLCNTFGFVLFATVSYTFIGFVNASYNLLKSYQYSPLTANDGEDHFYIIPRMIRLAYVIVEHLFRLWLMCHTADLIRAKALSLVPVLQSIRNDLYSRQGCNDESHEVHTFLLEVSETSPTFGVLGMFTLTKHIIISLIGSTLTYLVVLCQFSTAADVNTSAPTNNSNHSS
ncbi:hypothetical protein OUZ56_027467 [Daphnia magna]|uniref:Gustatory receptor n=1 Tax=Daphnia magna TaxID=35525 RepID=A0ABQ9ZPV0_9CRUS|nr:hypothetical protein OUZ56_027467 [Daphnia magna]